MILPPQALRMLLNPLPMPSALPKLSELHSVEGLLLRDAETVSGLTCYHFFLCLRGLRVYAFTACTQRRDSEEVYRLYIDSAGMAREAVGDENWFSRYDAVDSSDTWHGSIKYNARRRQYVLLDDDRLAPKAGEPRARRELGVVDVVDRGLGTTTSSLVLTIPRVTYKVTHSGVVCACAQFRPRVPEESLTRASNTSRRCGLMPTTANSLSRSTDLQETVAAGSIQCAFTLMKTKASQKEPIHSACAPSRNLGRMTCMIPLREMRSPCCGQMRLMSGV